MGQKRVQNEVPAMDSKTKDEFSSTFPELGVCGKNNEYYKCNTVLEFLKGIQDKTFASTAEFSDEVVKKCNKLHSYETNKGNGKPEKNNQEFYMFKDTPKYIQLKCAVSAKCKFMIWFDFEKKGDEFTKIKHARGINLNHEIPLHKEANQY